ncbi:hypothetical protein AB0J86_22820 [Micromonospora sp. NPDC049559]|uniref:hypothetical protein n=1 Tax=Micromonospora sp. NPDC049559 TaxID=3155923 RepID=UPI00341944A4
MPGNRSSKNEARTDGRTAEAGRTAQAGGAGWWDGDAREADLRVDLGAIRGASARPELAAPTVPAVAPAPERGRGPVRAPAGTDRTARSGRTATGAAGRTRQYAFRRS